MELTNEEYSRYGRQMQVPEFGSLNSQINLKNSKILVIGCGGLGSSALLYLASSGIGKIGLLDHDKVEISNLHRQIIHDSNSIGLYKTESAFKRLKLINPNLTIIKHSIMLDNLNSIEIFNNYDLILDCTDNPITKYLISDTCIVTNKPLVSASSVKTDGQLIILNYQNGPCYRCIHPKPTKPENISTCSDDGVIGPCVGLVGVLMSIESIKILTNYYNLNNNPYKPIMLMYSGYNDNNGQSIKSFKMRGKQSNCICNKLTKEIIKSTNYLQFCGSINYNILNDKFRINFDNLKTFNNDDQLVIDVRPIEQFNICNLKTFNENDNINLINLPYTKLIRLNENELKEILPIDKTIVSVCKMGNDSRLATKYLIDKGYKALDLKGGLNEYSKSNKFNIYW